MRQFSSESTISFVKLGAPFAKSEENGDDLGSELREISNVLYREQDDRQ
jgi:hypothetical protein